MLWTCCCYTVLLIHPLESGHITICGWIRETVGGKQRKTFWLNIWVFSWALVIFFVLWVLCLWFFCCFVRVFSGRNANGSLKLLRMLKTVLELKIPVQITDKMLSNYEMPYWYAEQICVHKAGRFIYVLCNMHKPTQTSGDVCVMDHTASW